jgi:hypothetical protein
MTLSRTSATAQKVAHLATGNPRPLLCVAYTIHVTEAQAHRDLYRYRIRPEALFGMAAEVPAGRRRGAAYR